MYFIKSLQKVFDKKITVLGAKKVKFRVLN